MIESVVGAYEKENAVEMYDSKGKFGHRIGKVICGKVERILFLLLPALLAVVLAACGQGTADVEARFLNGQGKPLSKIKVRAFQAKPVKGYDRFKTTTDSIGRFRIKGLLPNSQYLICPRSDEWKTSAKFMVLTGPEGKTTRLRKDLVVRFITRKNGVIVDSLLGLEWAPSNDCSMNWYDAVRYATGLRLAGGGWRLPSMSEVQSMYDESMEGHADQVFGIDRNWVWTSCSNNDGEAWFFSFENAYEGVHSKEWLLTRGRVLAVRTPDP